MYNLENIKDKIKLCEDFGGIQFEGDLLNKEEVNDFLDEYLQEAKEQYIEYLKTYEDLLCST